MIPVLDSDFVRNSGLAASLFGAGSAVDKLVTRIRRVYNRVGSQWRGSDVSSWLTTTHPPLHLHDSHSARLPGELRLLLHVV